MNFNRTGILVLVSLLVTPFAAHADNAFYNWKTTQLVLPTIDTEYQQGAYHDAVLEFNGGDAWRIKSITHALETSGIREVRVIQTDTFPVQVFLEVDGTLGRTCGKLYLDQRRVGNTFEVSIQQALLPTGVVCAAVAAEYSWIVPLDVYGLPLGEYRYTVNKYAQATYDLVTPLPASLTGSFTFTRDNFFARAAPEFPRFKTLPTSTVPLAP